MESRCFEIVLYPESSSYNCSQVLQDIVSYYDTWAYILHDKDWLEDGTQKKPHYHVYVRSSSPRPDDRVSRMTGCPLESIRHVKSWRGAIRYLIHFDHPEKAQYDISSVASSFDIRQYLNNSDSITRARRIYSYIYSNECKCWRDLVSWSLDNDCWSEVRRSPSIWGKLLEQK